MSLPHERHGPDEKLVLLDWIEARDRTNHLVVLAQPEIFLLRDLAPLQLVHVDSVHHHRTPAGDAEPPSFVVLRLGDIDHRVRDPRQRSLERQIEALTRTRVTLVMNAVKRVDRGHAGPFRGQPAIEAGALAMGVNDLGLCVAYEARDAPQRHREGAKGVDRHAGELDAGRPEVRREALVPRTRDGDPELVRGQMPHEIEDLPRAAAERGAGQELQDANHATLLSPPILTFAVSRAADQSREAGAQNVVDVRAPTVDHPSNSR